MSKHMTLRVIPLCGDLVARALVDTDLMGDVSRHDTEGDIRYHVSGAIELAAEQWEEEAGLPFMTIPDDRLEEAKEALLKRVNKLLDRKNSEIHDAIEACVADGILTVPGPEYYRSV